MATGSDGISLPAFAQRLFPPFAGLPLGPLLTASLRSLARRRPGLFERLGDAKTLEYEILHRDCIARFGRYPRRNEALGRVSTPEEIAYINSGDGMF